MNRLVILGAGGHSKVVLDTAKKLNYNNIILLDDNKKGKKVNGILVKDCIESYRKYISKNTDFFIAIGNNFIRKKLYEMLNEDNANLINIIHPNSMLSEDVKIGKANFIMKGVIINSSSYIGNNNILNTNAVIEHDCCIGDNNHLSPSVTIGGSVKIENNTWIGLGANIINNVNIGKNVMVGAGSVVINNLESNLKVAGIPARKI